ncbi:hypothetical protein D3OALGA1CA_5080 [Olavius algarvensis associated proteobacterium Delta 3]|nr:hypothetical protein D3OALGA1CA_5080 [Olavius algarvensis associated proteobacterium Delta 3]
MIIYSGFMNWYAKIVSITMELMVLTFGNASVRSAKKVDQVCLLIRQS